MSRIDSENAGAARSPQEGADSGRSAASGSGSPSLGATVAQSREDLQRAKWLSRQASPPAQVPGYRIHHCLGAGAFGTVWLATQENTGKQVAIKFYDHRAGLDWSLLNREVEKLAFLAGDRDIVQLIEVGWDSTPPYYVMEYLEQGSLEHLLRAGPVPVPEAVRLVTEVVQALVHAQGRGILHCDLKPANVLLDNDWKVRLADFGQSRLSHEQDPALGTLFYMAPEQADLKAAPDARWDVYAVGALLYHLLTGRPPYHSPELADRLQQLDSLPQRLAEYRRAIRSAPRPVAHRQVRGIDRPLAEIVDRCLAVNPARRFPNAQAVLEALYRRQRHRAQRPLLVLGLVAPLLLLVATIGLFVFGWLAAVHQSQTNLVQAELAVNVHAARGVASQIILRLRDLAMAVRVTARKDQLRQLLANPDDRAALQRFTEREHESYGNLSFSLMSSNGNNPVASLVIMDAEGYILARSPFDDKVISDPSRSGRKGFFGWRDYYQGALRCAANPSGPAVYISRVIRSRADGRYRFCISTVARSREPDGPVAGVVVATFTTGRLAVDYPHRTTLLVGRWDTNLPPWQRQPAGEPPGNLILYHPAYRVGDEAVAVQNRVIDFVQRCQAGRPPPADRSYDEDFQDPLGQRHSRYSGRWLAGFAPVGTADLPTEFVVGVQQRYAEAVRPVKTLSAMLLWRGCAALSVGVLLLSLMWYYVQRAMGRQSEQVRRRFGAAVTDFGSGTDRSTSS